MNVIPKHLEATTAKLVEIGCEVEEFDDAVRVVATKRRLNSTTCEDPALSGISDGYAATDWCDAGACAREPVSLRRAFLRTGSSMWTNWPEWEPMSR